MKDKLYELYNIDNLGDFKKYYNLLMNLEEPFIDFEQVLPDSMLDTWKEFRRSCEDKLVYLDRGEYISAYINAERLFDRLCEAKINALAYKAFLNVESNDTVKSVLETFRYNSSKYSTKVEYDRVANISGRLVVKKGPNILTLPRRCRTILETRFKVGKVISIDFSALEPRICLKLNNSDISGDVYDFIKNQIGISVDRSVIKRAVISILYGANYKSLSMISELKAKELCNAIIDLFGMNNLLELSKNKDINGVRRNFFGRPIWNNNETREHILINNYIQSTAVDLALTYFTDLTDILDLTKAVPLFILHDAMIFDVDNSYEKDFVNIIKKGYVNKELGHFPLKIDIFNAKEEN